MKRQRKIKAVNFTSFFKKMKKSILEKTAGVIVAFIAVLVIFVIFNAFLYRSDYFKVKSVEVKNTFLDTKSVVAINNQLLSICKGRNIFRINLKSISETLQRSYPDTKDIVVRIALPDKIVASLRFRKPVALIRGLVTYPIDEDGFMLPSRNIERLKNLPVIEGAEVRYYEQRGKKAVSKNLKLALELLKAIRASRFISDCQVETINARDVSNLSFYIKGGLEIRIGCDDFDQRLEALEKTLKDPRLVVDSIKYIDLRFKDVIIGPK